MSRRRIALIGPLVALLALLAPVVSVSAASTWGMSRTPSTVSQTGSTTVHVEFWNLGGDDGTSDLGCVEIDIPLTFTVGTVTVVDQPAGTTWIASKPALNVVRIRARNGGSRLNWDSPDHVAVDIVVSALVPGLLPWDAHAHSDQQCAKDFSEHISLSFTAGPAPTATPAPTPAPTPTPALTAAPTPTPAPTPAPTPQPTPKPTTAATPTPTPRPTATSSTAPTPTPTATLPSATPSDPVASPSPSTTPLSSGSPAPTGPTPSSGASPSTGTGTGTGTGGGSTTDPGSGGSGVGGLGPGSQIAMPGVDGSGTARSSIVVSGLSALSFGGVEWLVPGLVLTVPGLLIVLVVLLQVAGALAWMPVARRRLGGTEESVRRVPSRVSPPR